MRVGIFRPLLVVAVGASFALAGCGEAAGPDLAATVKAATNAMNSVDRLHFSFDTKAAGIQILPGMTATRIEGDVVRPDRIQAELQVKASGMVVTLDFRAIGEDQYITNPLARAKWQALPASSIGKSLLDPNAGVTTILAGLKDLNLIGKETVDGVEVYRISGSTANSNVAAYLPGEAAAGETAVEVWIGVADSLVRRVVLTGPSLVGDPAEAVRTIEFSRLNVPVEIVAPV